MKTEKVRVHEFARQHNVPSREILKLLRDGGFDVGSHMSMLDQKALTFLNQRLLPSEEPKKEKQIKSMSTTQSRRKPGKSRGGAVRKRFHFPSEELPKKPVEEKSLPKELAIEPMTPDDVSKKIGEPATGVILTLLKWGIVCPKKSNSS
ncbi:translation initiation factor IF-2 N-terminal domain-containing protein [Candidatus Dependentiae bacterium]